MTATASDRRDRLRAMLAVLLQLRAGDFRMDGL